MKAFHVTDPVFKTEPLFLLGGSFADLQRYLERFSIDPGEDIGQAGQMFTFPRSPWRVVWTKRLHTGHLLHEIFHLVTRICEDKGIPIKAHIESGEPGDEAAAYLYEFFAVEALRRLRKR